MEETIYIRDVVARGEVVAAVLGDGPDGVVLLQWLTTQRRFVAWETKDGTTWNRLGHVEIPGNLDEMQAIAVAQQLVDAAIRSVHGERLDELVVRVPPPMRKTDNTGMAC